ncbi:acyl-CoA dehydratase activase [Desulfoluna spongiiphila]|uniref:acyl-CoA dehydratase activase n=1 Tax=Desulfoluna spongiiphila TaxID=419481 RepID=UPI00125B3DD4|nr:acyl-CoA dehydratase activase [Desulfoluna spongiiphila]VVS93160.1 atpase badf/badg/bcra/bcrd type [Desulfoluna spongiiphila]
MKAGLDFGSKYIHYAVLDADRVVANGSILHNGNLEEALTRARHAMETEAGGAITRFGVTGNITLSEARVFDPVIASVEAATLLKTPCKNILSIGCESFYLIRLDDQGNYVEHVVNSDCASGTGSFIDQQAERLGFSTEALAEKAAAFTGKAPSIATRCAVFAKSDIIHAQAQGYAKEAIATGLCEGVARSVLANTVRGRELAGDLLFIGGMAANTKIVREVEAALGLAVSVPESAQAVNAIGAASLADQPWESSQHLISRMGRERTVRPVLDTNMPHYPAFDGLSSYEADGIEVTLYQAPEKACEAYMGIDVGSTSTKAVLTDKKGTILAGLYGRTQGDPVDAVTRLFAQVKELFKEVALTICGVATTGSGRELIKEVIGADLAINEITAHAKGATFLDPAVDTIIEIGGQDSKFTLLNDGVVKHAVMNYVCAAGTGSFIEEQAKRLHMTLPEISDIVEGAKAPFTSDRCTVYMERDLNIFLSEGWKKAEIMSAVLHSVRDNYLSKVVGKSTPGKRVYFQGATARNKALVACFERELGQKVLVSKFCHLTGALGCAVALKDAGLDASSFTGIDFSCTVETETCELCTNRCELRIYTVGDKKNAWGLKCGRDYEDKKVGGKETVSGLEKQFKAIFKTEDASAAGTKTIGIPETLFMVEYAPLFKDLFQRLGFNVVVEKSTAKKLAQGMKLINADFCTPMALTHGMVAALDRPGVDYIFLPTLISEQSLLETLPMEQPFGEKSTDSYFCYYSSYAATIINNLPGMDFGGRLLHPTVRMNNVADEIVGERLAADLAPILDLPEEAIVHAFIDAKKAFSAMKKVWVAEGSKRLANRGPKPKILLLGRPYALFDKRVNLGIPARMESMGFEIVSQSMLDLAPTTGDLPDHLDNMHWYFGQQILLALDAVRKNPDLYPVFLTCFRCSPDAYLMNHIKDAMEKMGKPYLILQLDEHASDVGYLTRIEAAIDTFVADYDRRKAESKEIVIPRTTFAPDTPEEGDTVLIPMVDARINRLQAEVFKAAGYKAEVLPMDNTTLNLGYRFASGGECLPNVAIVGSVISRLSQGDLAPEQAIVYLPNICLSCNFNQYANLVKAAGTKAGYAEIKVMNTNGQAAVPGISARHNAQLLSVTILSSILSKLRFRFLPYETEEGATMKAVGEAEAIIAWHIANRKSLMTAAEKVRELFGGLPLPKTRKPRIAILGDMYAKYNEVLNEAICDHAEALGGEVILPSYNELVVHSIFADTRQNHCGEKLLGTMTGYEEKFEAIFDGLLEGVTEPPLDECQALMEEFGLTSFIAGETAVSLGRMLYYVKHGLVSAVIHVNPVFCCPGVISASIFRKIQERYGVPVIDLFYDGTNKPNRMIDPHMFYLTRKAG